MLDVRQVKSDAHRLLRQAQLERATYPNGETPGSSLVPAHCRTDAASMVRRARTLIQVSRKQRSPRCTGKAARTLN
jgi:hypothetical protein